MTLHWKRRCSIESLDDETSVELTVEYIYTHISLDSYP